MKRKRTGTFQLGELVTLKRGYDLPESKRTAGNYPIISSSGMSGSHNEYRVEGPGVVTGRYGTLGEVFYVAKRFWPLNTTLYVHDYKGNSPRFISYYLRTVLSGDFNAAGAVPGVSRSVLHRLGVPEPPCEQNKIAAILSAYDDLIETNRGRIAWLEKMGEEIYREWFVRLRFPGHRQVKVKRGVPEGWEVTRLTDMVDFLSGHPFKSETYSPVGRYGIVTIKNVQDGFFVPECSDYVEEVPSTMKQHCYLQTGDMLMSLTGQVGRVCHVCGRQPVTQSAGRKAGAQVARFQSVCILDIQQQKHDSTHRKSFAGKYRTIEFEPDVAGQAGHSQALIRIDAQI